MEAKNNQRQAKTIGNYEEKSEERARKTKAIQEAYLTYSETLAGRDLDVLLKLSEDYCIGYVRRKLHEKNCYSTDNEEEVLTESRIGVWDYITRHRKDAEKRTSFAGVVHMIYRNKTFDCIRKVINEREKHSSESLTDDEGKVRDIAIEEDPLLEMIRQRRMNMAVKVSHIYCEVVMNSDGSADYLLSLCYARLLPHLLDEILESIATSAKWAYKRMEGKSFDELRQESEKIIKGHFQDGTLSWGQSFLDNLSELIEVNGNKVPRGNAIYTKLHDQAQIGHMSDYMHNRIRNAARDIIAEQEDLVNVIVEYYDENTVIGKLAKGGETR